MDGKADKTAQEIESRRWWMAVSADIYHKLYGPAQRVAFYRDLSKLAASLYYFRSRCVGRGWEIPHRTQQLLISKLVSRCEKALCDSEGKNGIRHDYIPAYLGKSLANYVDDIADEAQRKWKRNEKMGELNADAAAGLIRAAMLLRATEMLERI